MARSPLTGLAYSRAYPGESEDKRAARLFIYRYASLASRCGHAITLAGTEPYAEVWLLQNYLKWPGTHTHFVDWAKDTQTRNAVIFALSEIKRQWPEADVVRGDVNNVIDDLPLIGFANLDFMGFNRDSVIPCVKRTIHKLAPGGVMALTCFRGREIDAIHRSAWDVFEASRDIDDLNSKRWAGVTRLVQRWGREARKDLVLLGALEYQHNHSPMMVTVWRRSWV